MSIRFKIGIGFVILIVTLTSMISWWAARSLGLSLEASDQERLEALRNETLQQWADESARLTSLAAGVASSFAGFDLTGRDHETAVWTAERLRRTLGLDWVELLHDGKPQLFPSVTLLPISGTSLPWPMRLSRSGTLSERGFLVVVSSLSGTSDQVLVARRVRPPVGTVSDGSAAKGISAAFLWDDDGMLVGADDDLPRNQRLSYQNPGQTFQRLQQGRLWRVRSSRLGGNGPWLLVGYEADAATLTRTGVNELMLQLAVLEMLGLLILGWFLGGWLFGPLERLRGAIERVAAGHWQEIPDAAEGNEIGTVARSFNRMVRELSLAQQRLLEVQQELLQKEKMAVLGRFSAGVAHEINNPLGTILVSAGMAREALEAGQHVEREDLEAIIDETRRCRAIVDSLLSYARNKPPELRSIALSEVLATVLPRLGQTAGEGLRLVVPPEIPAIAVLVDVLGIEQILQNLCRNARDALEKRADGKIWLEIGIENPEWVTLVVADNGPGLEGVSEHLFEPFVTTKASGTGLGLAICQSIVEGHGGRIWARREPEGITRFGFTLRRG